MTRTYGQIVRGDGVWGVRAEPHVLIKLKRLFPRVAQHRSGAVILKDTIEVARDLEWFTTRYPLRMDEVTAAYLCGQAEQHRATEQAVLDILAGQQSFTRFREPARPPRTYQVQAADIVLATGRLLLADDIGLGKTFSALLVLRDPAALPALVVAPTHLPWQWLDELSKSLPWLHGHVITKGTPYNPATQRGSGGRTPDVWIMSYSKLAGWADHLAGLMNTVIFDEVQELRRGGDSAKGQAAYRVADKAAYRIGLSVGPDSVVELTGGPFGAGWVGRIADATALVAKLVPAEREGDHEVFRVGVLGVRSRGWMPSGFTWKPVRSFIQHPCTSDVTRIRSGSGFLSLTGDHAVYRVAEGNLALTRAGALRVGDRLAGDNGRGWDTVAPEIPVDVIQVAGTLSNAQVVVDLGSTSREALGVTAWQWQNFHREGKYGTRLPVDLYRRHAGSLPSPSAVYLSAGRGGRRMTPRLLLSEWAYMLGFYLGDGWVSEGRICFAVETARAPGFADRIRQLPGVQVDPTVRPMPGASVEVRFGHPIVAELLRRELGGAKCYEKAVPGEWIVSWPEHARRELLQGLLDSDGHISARNERRYYTTTSATLADSMLSLLRSLGITGSVSVTQPGPGGVVAGRRITGQRSRYTVNWSAHSEAADNTGWRGTRTRFGWTRGLLHEAAVRDVAGTDTPPAIVYDLEMDGHPSFVANGLLVHNSATPVFNYGGEIHNIMGALAPDALGTRDEFLREWGSGQYGMARHAAVKDPAALGTYLRDQGLLLRRTRKDLHMEITEPIQVEQRVDTDHATIEQVAADIADTARILLGETATNTERWQAAGEVDWRMRQATGVAKAPYVAEFVKLLLESEQRVVVFGWHRDVYDIWLEKLRAFHPVLYTGSESPQQKARNAQMFMGGQSRVLLMSLRSGSGLDGLQKWASIAVFGELDWSPEMHKQATGRLHRDGQDSTVVAYYMVSDDGTDPLMSEVLGIKKQQAEPIRDPSLPLFTSLMPGTDRARRLAAEVLSRVQRRAR